MDIIKASLMAAVMGGGGANLGTKSITANGTYQASDDSLDGYSEVTVNVPIPTMTSATFTQNGTYTASANTGWNSITVNVPSSGGDVGSIWFPSSPADGVYPRTGAPSGTYYATDNVAGYSHIYVGARWMNVLGKKDGNTFTVGLQVADDLTFGALTSLTITDLYPGYNVMFQGNITDATTGAWTGTYYYEDTSGQSKQVQQSGVNELLTYYAQDHGTMLALTFG